jgi:hypothetical protein
VVGTGGVVSPCWAVWALLTCAACAPSAYAVHETRAERAVERARKLDARENAVYEFTLAEAYLQKSREESSEAAYQDAIRLAKLAQEHAQRAVEQSRARLAPEAVK